jgi:hypothetical protein
MTYEGDGKRCKECDDDGIREREISKGIVLPEDADESGFSTVGLFQREHKERPHPARPLATKSPRTPFGPRNGSEIPFAALKLVSEVEAETKLVFFAHVYHTKAKRNRL